MIPPGTLVIEGDRQTYYPNPAGLVTPPREARKPGQKGAPAGVARHPHVPRIITWSLEGPLRAYIGCANCSKGKSVNPSRLIRNVPQGFTDDSWAKFLDKADERAKEANFKSHSAYLKAWRTPKRTTTSSSA